MLDLLSLIPSKKKRTPSGWTVFNAVCCVYRGHSPDKRMRGGVRIEQHTQIYHCFNCGFKAGFTLGKPITSNTRLLLSYLGIDKEDIDRLNFESLQHRDILDYINVDKLKKKINFDEMSLPEEAELIDINNQDHSRFVEYLGQRQLTTTEYPFMCTPTMSSRHRNRIIVPFTYKNKIVGYTSRYIDGNTPKYINQQPSGYLFGIDFQKPEYQVCIVVEGIFDALSINGCALGTNTISETHVHLLKQMNKKIIIVPDHDKPGLEIIESALDNYFYVSIPDWEPDIKDVNDAVVRYGKFPTLLSILQSATRNKIKLEIQRKQIVNRL